MGREEGSRWGTHVYLWQIHLDIWQNQYNIVKFKNKIKLKKKREYLLSWDQYPQELRGEVKTKIYSSERDTISFTLQKKREREREREREKLL